VGLKKKFKANGEIYKYAMRFEQPNFCSASFREAPSQIYFPIGSKKGFMIFDLFIFFFISPFILLTLSTFGSQELPRKENISFVPEDRREINGTDVEEEES
jgi:hypothetical protein